MKTNSLSILALTSALLFSFNSHAQKIDLLKASVTSQEIQTAVGEWEGSLTYIDYSSGKPYTMPANVNISLGKNAYELILQNIFPNEPKANNTERIKISKDGGKLNGKIVESKKVQSNGDLQITTTLKGKDNKRKALIKYIYLIGNDEFSITKHVQFIETEAWLKRSEFKYQRIPD